MSFEGNKFNKGLSQYSTNEVIEFAKQLGLDNYSKKIEELQIDGYDLSIINDNLIKYLEILNPHDLNKLFPIEDNRKRRKSKTTLGPKKFYKNIKRVTIDNPFISVVPIESYKEYNLKMTYSEYESVPDSNKIGSICPCQKPLCYIF